MGFHRLGAALPLFDSSHLISCREHRTVAGLAREGCMPVSRAACPYHAKSSPCRQSSTLVWHGLRQPCLQGREVGNRLMMAYLLCEKRRNTYYVQ